jgi:lysophospholipase L1-like esterase
LYSLYAVEGKLPEEITVDGLHLTAEGYAKWYEVLRAENVAR